MGNILIEFNRWFWGNLRTGANYLNLPTTISAAEVLDVFVSCGGKLRGHQAGRYTSNFFVVHQHTHTQFD